MSSSKINSTQIKRLWQVVVVIAGVAFATSSAAQPANAPIKVGVMFPLTGPIAANGKASRDAVKQAFEEDGNRIAGRPVQLFYEDSQGKPDVGLTKIKALVERDHVDVLVSVVVSTVAAAVAPYIREAKVPWVTTASLVGLTRDLKSPYTFRMMTSSYQYAIDAAEWAKKQGWKKLYYIGWNAAPAREAYEALKLTFGEQNIVEALFPNVGTPDYAPYLSKLDPSKADGVLVAIWGADAPRILRQFAEYGLKAKMPFFGVASFTAEEALADMPPEVEGIYSAYVYCGTLDSEANKRFVENYRKLYKVTPGPYPYLAYMAAKAAIQALKDVNGRAEDHDAVAAALRKVQLDGPMGKVFFDERQGMVADAYTLKVVKKDGTLQNECMQRIPESRDPYNLFP
jgi:branched-chain amino acid transport system substrate-binding protein